MKKKKQREEHNNNNKKQAAGKKKTQCDEDEVNNNQLSSKKNAKGANRMTETVHQCLFDSSGPPHQTLSAPVQQSLAHACVSCIHYQPLASISSLEAAQIRASLVSYLSNASSDFMQLTPDDRTFTIDTRASITITNCITDFICHLQPVKPNILKGIDSGLTVEGLGLVTYSFMADVGRIVELQLANILYVLKCPLHLLYPGHIAENTGVSLDGFNSV